MKTNQTFFLYFQFLISFIIYSNDFQLSCTKSFSFYAQASDTPQPSGQPTAQPSCQPSSQPSRQPTGQPSGQPSSMPSINLCPSVIATTLSAVPATAKFKQSNFLFGTSPVNSNIYRSIPASQGSLGSNYIIYGGSGIRNKMTLSTTGSLPNHASLLSYGITSDSNGMRSIDTRGDYNKDGKRDLLVGDPNAGKVYVFYGRTSSSKPVWTALTLGFTITAKSTSGLGWAVSTAGDFNRDGVDDMLVSAIYSNVVYLIYGKSENSTTIQLTTTSIVNADGIVFKPGTDTSLIYFGVALSWLGDINGDGWPDLGITAARLNGANYVYLIYGQITVVAYKLLTLNDLLIDNIIYRISTPSLSFIGLSIDNAGDVNKDGYQDFILGGVPYIPTASGYTIQRSHIIYGRPIYVSTQFNFDNLLNTTGYTIEGAGLFVSGIGDVNSDGYADVMVSSYISWSAKSGSYVIVMPDTQSSAPSYFPTSRPSMVTRAPTRLPSSIPTPAPTRAPTTTPAPTVVNGTAPPIIPPTLDPTATPTLSVTPGPTVAPTRNPTRTPTTIPTLLPSFIPTVSPTRAPTARPTNKPTAKKTALPTSQPSSNPTVIFKYVNITTGGRHYLNYGNEIIRVKATESVKITGRTGAKTYQIYPASSMTVTITDFSIYDDTLDLTLIPFSSSSMSTYSYTTVPLTLGLPNKQYIVLSSHQGYDLMTGNIILPDSSSSSSTDDSSSDPIMALFSSDILQYVMILLCLFIFSFVVMNMQGGKNETKQKRSLDTLLERQIKAVNAARLAKNADQQPSAPGAVHPEPKPLLSNTTFANQSKANGIPTNSNAPTTTINNKDKTIILLSEPFIAPISSPSNKSYRKSRVEREKSIRAKTSKDKIPITTSSSPLISRKSKSSQLSSNESSIGGKSPKMSRALSKRAMFPKDDSDVGKNREEGDDSEGSDFDSFSFSSETFSELYDV